MYANFLVHIGALENMQYRGYKSGRNKTFGDKGTDWLKNVQMNQLRLQLVVLSK